MCYDSQATPPLPPAPVGPAHGQDLILTAADGNRFAAYAARPAQPPSASILIYPDIRGLHQFYKELALRFAEIGIAAVALDYFGRTAGLTARDDAFEWQPHVAQLRLPTVYADAQAGLAHLRAAAAAPCFVVGFCLGGSLALYTATEGFGLAGIIGFYAGLTRKMDEQKGSVLEAARLIQTPVLGLFGGADPGIPPELVQTLDETVDQAGVPHAVITYPGAPHSFLDRRAADFAAASEDAWRRLLAFITAHGTPAAR